MSRRRWAPHGAYSRIEELESQLRDARRTTDAATDEINKLHDRLTEDARVLADVFNSPSWRLTKPLRQAKHMLSRDQARPK